MLCSLCSPRSYRGQFPARRTRPSSWPPPGSSRGGTGSSCRCRSWIKTSSSTCSAPTRPSRHLLFDIIIRSISYFLFFCHLVKSPNPKRWLKEINALQFHQDSQVVQFILYLFIWDLDEIIFLVCPPSNKKLDAAFSTEITLFSDCKIRIGISFKLNKFPISYGLSCRVSEQESIRIELEVLNIFKF